MPEELKPSWVKLKDQQQRIEDLEALIMDMNDLMHRDYPYTWNATKDGIMLQQRMRELRIVRKEL